MASAYLHLEELNKCLHYGIQQYNVALKLNSPQYTIDTLLNLGTVNMHLKDYDNALAYLDNSLKLANTFDASNQSAKLKQLNLLGECFIKLKNYEKALGFFLQQLEVTKKLLLDDKVKASTDSYVQIWFLYCIALLNIGLLYLKLSKSSESVDWYIKALNNLKKNGEFKVNCLLFKYQVLSLYNKAYTELISIYLNAKDYENASFYALNMLDFSLKENELIRRDVNANEACDKHDADSERLYGEKSSRLIEIRISKGYRMALTLHFSAKS